MDVDAQLVVGQCLYMCLLAFAFVITPVSGIVIVGSLVTLPVCTIICLSAYQKIQLGYQLINRWTPLQKDLVKILTVPTFFTPAIIILVPYWHQFFISLYMSFIVLIMILKEKNLLLIESSTSRNPVQGQSRPQYNVINNLNKLNVTRKRSPDIKGVNENWVKGLMEALKCCVCHSTLAPDVVMCARGHAICRVCKNRGVLCCPLCYQRFLPLVCNTLVKQIIDSIPNRYHDH